MKLKALLLGSAAAMIAVTGAKAADAVIAEPEPVEYVRVCDLYGASWFYIPGTETCLSVGGYIRVEYDYQDNDVGASGGNFQYRARLDIQTRNETDYGTLAGWIRLQGGEGGSAFTRGNITAAGVALPGGGGLSDAVVGVDRALISLAGFRLGYSDDFWTTAHGYGGRTDIGDGFYGYGQGTFFDYTYAANGFSATAGLNYRGNPGNPALAGIVPAVPQTADTRELDYYFGLGYTASWGGLAGTIIHDNVADEWAYKISGDLNVIEGLQVRGWYAGNDTATKYVTGEHMWGVGARYAFTDTLAVGMTYSQSDGFVAAADAELLTVGLDWTPAPGLRIRPEVQFVDTSAPAGAGDFTEYSVRVYRTF